MLKTTAIWLAKIAAALFILALALGWLGPHLNAMPDKRAEFTQADSFDAKLQRDADEAMAAAQDAHRCLNSPAIAGTNGCVVRKAAKP